MGMKIIAFIFLGFATAGFIWIWIASLINHACNQWWIAREAYRKRMDGEVYDILRDKVEKFN